MDDDRDSMPLCWWPEQPPIEKRPLPGWPRHRVGADRSVWVRRKRGWRRLKPRLLNGRPAVVLRHEGREYTRMVELLHRATFSTWPDRWIPRIGPGASARPVPRPDPPPGPMLPQPAIAAAEAPKPAPIAPPPLDDDDDGPRRIVVGSAHGRARLTEAKVIEARALHAAGVGLEALMKRYGVARMTLYYALSGKTWQHVPMPEAPGPRRLARAEKGPVQKARDMSDGGMSAEAIAEELGVSARTIYRYLS